MASDLHDEVRPSDGQPAAFDDGLVVGWSADPARWSIAVDPLPPEHRRVWEALTCVSDGVIGVRGLWDAPRSPSRPALVAAGVFDHSGDTPTLLHGPMWTTIRLEPADGWSETIDLDLSHGIVTIVMTHPLVDQPVRVRRWMSFADPGVGVQCIEGPSVAIVPTEPLVRPTVDDELVESTITAGVQTVSVLDVESGRGLEVSAHETVDDEVGARRVVRLAAATIVDAPSSAAVSPRRLDTARRRGVADLERRHREAWTEQWSGCGTWIRSDPELDRALRFATFHLLSHGGPPSSTGGDGDDFDNGHDGEVAIGARGLTGAAYRGHVFWDTDVFVTPALSAIAPHGARRTLMYRWNRLAPAMAAARREGHNGARFPWESADSGVDVTPQRGTDLHGVKFPIRTGDLEVHIVGDIAWSVWNHLRWTGDDDFLRRYGLPILVETARYWASRVERDEAGSVHIRGVIGPDEYHEDVDDNSFTNIIARHNLRIAATAAQTCGGVGVDERRRWNAIADALVDGYDPTTGVYEQFAGFTALDPILVDTIGAPPLSADALLGRETIQRVQVTKQPDVLMAYHLMPHETEAGSLDANLDFYIPRTAAGSSLAPPICASLLARAGRLETALRWFDLSARLDLDDVTGTTAGGLHLATMGGLWQAMTRGFLGIDVVDDALGIDPRVPPRLGRIAHRFRFRGVTVTVAADGDDVIVGADRPVGIVCGEAVRRSEQHHLVRRSNHWEYR